jgi:hypothetical protein
MKTLRDRRWLFAGITGALAAGLALAMQIGRDALMPVAVYSGWVLLALVLALTFFNARKKLPFLPLFSASTWLQFHIYIGWLSCFVFLLHTGARIPAGRLEGLLAAVFAIVAASGAFGLWLSRWLPPRLVRSGESLIYERIPVLRHRLAEEVSEIFICGCCTATSAGCRLCWPRSRATTRSFTACVRNWSRPGAT